MVPKLRTRRASGFRHIAATVAYKACNFPSLPLTSPNFPLCPSCRSRCGGPLCLAIAHRCMRRTCAILRRGQRLLQEGGALRDVRLHGAILLPHALEPRHVSDLPAGPGPSAAPIRFLPQQILRGGHLTDLTGHVRCRKIVCHPSQNDRNFAAHGLSQTSLHGIT